MEFKHEIDGKTANITISGIVDNDVADDLKKNLAVIGENFDIKKANIDLEFVPSIVSSGIGKLLVFYKALDSRGGSIKVTKCHKNLVKLFKSIKLDKLFDMDEVKD